MDGLAATTIIKKDLKINIPVIAPHWGHKM
jgi:hypothetical protein